MRAKFGRDPTAVSKKVPFNFIRRFRRKEPMAVSSVCILLHTIDGSTARRCTAIVTNERARLRQSVKFFGQSLAFKNTRQC